jgi:type IV pilus assembly protein PilC
MADRLDYFSYEAINGDGKLKKGKIPAASAADAIAALQHDGLIPVTVAPFVRGIGNIDIIKPKEERPLKLKLPKVATFARQLYLLLRAGLPLARALVVIGEDHDDIRYTRMCTQLSERTLAGVPLSKAMEEFPGCFDSVFRAYISAGEATGNMEEALFRLSRMLEKANQLRLKVKAVTAYPKLVSIVIFLVVMLIMLFLVPMYGRIYDGFGQKLPAPTRALLSVSQHMSPFHVQIEPLNPPFITDLIPGDHSLLTAPINLLSPLLWLLGGLLFWRWYHKRHADDIELGTFVDRVKYRLPVLGKLWKTAMLHRWSSTLAGGLSAGLQLHAALDVAAEASGSMWVKAITVDLKDAVQAGRPLSKQLALHKDLFDARLRAMASTGEEAGEPAEMFNNVALTLEDELDAMVAVLGAQIEVVLLVLMGVVVGSLLVVLYLPIFGLTDAASKGYEQTPPALDDMP